MLFAALGALWYLPFGTLLALLEIVLLLLSSARPCPMRRLAGVRQRLPVIVRAVVTGSLVAAAGVWPLGVGPAVGAVWACRRLAAVTPDDPRPAAL